MKLFVVIFLAFTLFVSGCSGTSSGTSSDPAIAKQDEQTATDIAKGAEARTWLSSATNKTFGLSKEEATKYVEEFYAAGSPKVTITNIEHLESEQVSATIVAEMPIEAEKRAAVLAVEKSFQAKTGGQGSEDKGQRYVTLYLD